jgi:inosine-uridine nucleoside N-ribohydrolase
MKVISTMNTNKNTQWPFYLGWILSGVIGLLITFPIALAFDVFVFNQILGDMLRVRGEMVITEDYMFWYAFIPWYGIVIGTIQYLLLRRRFAKMGWWILTTTLGWSLIWLGIAFRYNPLGDIEIPSSAGYFLIAGTGVGILIGVTQWLILRTQVPNASWWIPINGLGFGIASVILADIASLSEYLIVVTMPCISTGILLWLLLQRRLSQAGWWIAAHVVGWGLLALITAGSAPATTPTLADTCTSVPPTSTLIATTTPNETVGSKKMLLLYDDDGSRDGMAALLYLLSYPDISMLAITISYGEAHPKLYVQHMGCVLDIIGISDIPLGAGQDMPLAGGTPFPDWLRQLSDNFWDYPLPNADQTYPFHNAPELMVSIINQAPEPVTIFVSGPITNLAQALQLDPAIKDNILAVYFMGGAVYVPGNITNLDRDSNNRVADWNMIVDPQAAKEVFESGLELYMVPLDATNKVLFSQEDLLPWRQGDDKANMVVDLYDMMFNTWGLKTAEIFDLTAAVLMVQSESCNFQPLHLDVITVNGPTLGQTIVVPNTEPNIYVCLEPNVDQVKQNLSETFSR